MNVYHAIGGLCGSVTAVLGMIGHTIPAGCVFASVCVLRVVSANKETQDQAEAVIIGWIAVGLPLGVALFLLMGPR